MRILRSILGVLLAVMLSQRYKANELDWGSDWAVVLLIKTEQMSCQNQLYQYAFRIPGRYCLGARWKMEKEKSRILGNVGINCAAGGWGANFTPH